MKTKKVIVRGKRSKTITEAKPVKNISKNLQDFLEISTYIHKHLLGMTEGVKTIFKQYLNAFSLQI